MEVVDVLCTLTHLMLLRERQRLQPNNHWPCIATTHRCHASDERVIERLMPKFVLLPKGLLARLGEAITGTGLLILLGIDTRVFIWVLILLIVGLGHGFIFMSLNFGI